MTIHIELEDDEEQMLIERARLTGRDLGGYVHQLLKDHIRGDSDNLRQQGDKGDKFEAAVDDENLIDHDAIESCARAVTGQEAPSLDDVRRILAKITGSMTQVVVEEREDRF